MPPTHEAVLTFNTVFPRYFLYLYIHLPERKMMLSPFIAIHWVSLPEVSENERFYLGDTEDPMSLID